MTTIPDAAVEAANNERDRWCEGSTSRAGGGVEWLVYREIGGGKHELMSSHASREAMLEELERASMSAALLAAAPHMLKWRPIESAPASGWFLAYGEYLYPGDAEPTRYHSVARRSGNPDWPWEDDEGQHPADFFSAWLPLPSQGPDHD